MGISVGNMAETRQKKYVGDVGFMPQTSEESIQAAHMLKTEGGEYIKAGNYRDATACYRRMNLFLKHLDGMKEDIKIGDPSQDPSKNLTAEQKAEVQMLLIAMNNNLALAHLKQAEATDDPKKKAIKYQRAADAATEVLVREEGNSKARLRRAKAFAMLNNADGLRADLGWCDSSSKEVQSFQKRLAALDKKASGREQGMAQRMFAPSAAAAVVSEMELDMAAPGEQTEGQADAHI